MRHSVPGIAVIKRPGGNDLIFASCSPCTVHRKSRQSWRPLLYEGCYDTAAMHTQILLILRTHSQLPIRLRAGVTTAPKNIPPLPRVERGDGGACPNMN